MADKLTQQIVDALSKAAAEPFGLPLFASRAESGLFAATAKAACQKCLADRMLHVVRSETTGKSTRELYAPTDAGWEFLLASVNPKQVLEDFVRVLENRQGEVGELLATARQMADSLQGLKDAVARVLPQVSVNRIAAFSNDADCVNTFDVSSSPSRQKGTTALLDTIPAIDLTQRILVHLRDWADTANAGEDCPLPELFRGLADASLGEFHDCLRKLHAQGAIYLHPWTGPLYELPDPACALLVGHGVAYYASMKG